MPPATLREDACAYARQNGLFDPLEASQPSTVEYARSGHGFTVKVRELRAPGRSGTLHFRSDGKPSMWSLDGLGGV